jgi:chaperonin GroEL (HSP60 family)
VEKKVGGRMSETELVQGMAIDKEIVHPGMPTKIEDAKIALINASISQRQGLLR